MRKILFGILGVMLTVTVVGASARALFTTTVTVSGMNLSTGGAELRISPDRGTFYSSLPSVALSTGNTYPGWIAGQYFALKNASTADIKLSVTGKITGYSGSWATLKTVVQVAVVEYSEKAQADAAVAAKNPGGGTVVASTGWKNLEDWYAGAIAFGTNIDQDDIHDYVIWGKIPIDAGDEIKNKNVSTNWSLVGTQVP